MLIRRQRRAFENLSKIFFEVFKICEDLLAEFIKCHYLLLFFFKLLFLFISSFSFKCRRCHQWIYLWSWFFLSSYFIWPCSFFWGRLRNLFFLFFFFPFKNPFLCHWIIFSWRFIIRQNHLPYILILLYEFSNNTFNYTWWSILFIPVALSCDFRLSYHRNFFLNDSCCWRGAFAGNFINDLFTRIRNFLILKSRELFW